MFRGALKRFGYASDLSDTHLRRIADVIKLDVDEMQANAKSKFALVYLDDNFRSPDGRHNVRKLLRLGWITCWFSSTEEQEEELW